MEYKLIYTPSECDYYKWPHEKSHTKNEQILVVFFEKNLSK